ncbi:unnamed protein product, partial [Allacma fusca]
MVLNGLVVEHNKAANTKAVVRRIRKFEQDAIQYSDLENCQKNLSVMEYFKRNTMVTCASANLDRSPGVSKCDILKYVLQLATDQVGQKIEILVALSDNMVHCARSLTLPHHLLGVKSCSKEDWNLGNHYSHRCSSRPIYIFFVCDLQDTIIILNETFEKLILQFRWFIFYDSSSSHDPLMLENLSTLDFRLDSFLQIIDTNDRYNIQEAYKLSDNGSLVKRPAINWNGVGENDRDLQGIQLRVAGV